MTDKASNQQAVAITVGGGESNHIWRFGGGEVQRVLN
jgi:hypothetical protein